MQRNTLFSFLTVAALGLLTAGPVSAATVIWDGSTNTDWHTAANWDGNAVPGSSDDVVIADEANDPVISKTNAVANDLTIDSGAVLTIRGKTLTLSGATQTYNGNLVLSNNLAIVKFTADATVDGDGAIIGQDNGAAIEIADNKTLTNQMVIKGKMTIKEVNTSGTFFNGSTGQVLANVDGGTLLMKAGLTIDDASGASWDTVGDAGFTTQPVLQFDVGASCIDGNFVINDCGTIQLNNVSIDTRGSYTNNGGLLDLVGSVHFGHSCNAGCSECTTFNSDDCVTGAPSCSCS